MEKEPIESKKDEIKEAFPKELETILQGIPEKNKKKFGEYLKESLFINLPFLVQYPLPIFLKDTTMLLKTVQKESLLWLKNNQIIE